MSTLTSPLFNVLICYPTSLTFQTIIRYIFHKAQEGSGRPKIDIDAALQLELAKVMKTYFSLTVLADR